MPDKKGPDQDLGGRLLDVDEDDAKAPDIALDLSAGDPKVRVPRVAARVSRPVAPKRPARWPWLLLFVVFVGAGGALERTEHGAFFRHKIDALVHADERALLTEDTIAKVRDALGADSPDRARDALAAVDAALLRAPRHKPLLAWAAYTVFAHELRYGRDDARHGRAVSWLSSAGDRPHAFLAAAARDLLLNEPDKARAALLRAPQEVEAKLLLGAIELATKHPPEALRAFEEAVKLEPNPRTHAALARALEPLDGARAFDVATALAESDKGHVGARLILARLSYRAREMKAVTKWVAELGPLEKHATRVEKSELFTLRGLHALDRGEPEAARAAFDESVKLANGTPSVYTMVGLGQLALSAGKPAEARTHYDAAIAADPALSRARLGLASALIALGKLDDARVALDAISDPAVANEVTKLRALTTGKPKKK